VTLDPGREKGIALDMKVSVILVDEQHELRMAGLVA